MDAKRRVNNDVYIGIALALLSAFFLWESINMHAGAGLFPRIIFTLFLFLSLVIAALGVRKTINPALCTKDDYLLSFKVVKSPLIVFGTIALYVVLLNNWGFYISTTIFMPLFLFLFGERRIVRIILTTVGTNLIIYLLFVRLLNVVLP